MDIWNMVRFETCTWNIYTGIQTYALQKLKKTHQWPPDFYNASLLQTDPGNNNASYSITYCIYAIE